MANNLVSDQITCTSTQMGLNTNKENSSVNGSQMESMVPVYSESMSLEYPGDVHMELLSARTQGLPVRMMQTMGIGSPNYPVPQQFARQAEAMHGIGSQQLSATLKRKSLMEPSPNGTESLFSAKSMKREVYMEHRPWLQQVSMSNMVSTQMSPPATAPGRQNVHPPNKKKSQTEFLPVKLGSPRSANPKGQTARLLQSSKVKSESFESVRSKMRESLASALALVSQENLSSKASKSTDDKEETDHAKADVNLQVNLTSTEADSNKGKPEGVSKSDKHAAVPIGTVGLMPGEQSETSASPVEASAITYDNERDPSQAPKSDRQDLPSSYVLSTDDIPFSEGFFVKDELLQGNGLSWVLESDMGVLNQDGYQSNDGQMLDHEVDRNYEETLISPDHLASKIEAELFKLFGGVNKKYKEKGRSLLFNLKDPNNPDLRERVMSGEIPPERLCSMTAEELASKELSEWRIAKAEELAQMVVLPDSDVDIRRLVKKTHKGEFQVEVEYDDNVSVEVSGGANSVGQNQSKAMEGNEEGSGNHSKVRDKKAHSESDGRSDKAAKTKESVVEHNDQCSVTITSNSVSDVMQGMSTNNTTKDAEFLPPIVSLDEFMESLASDSPFENLPEVSGKKMPEKDDPDLGSELKSKPSSSDQMDRIPDELDSPCVQVEKDPKPSCCHPDKESGLNYADQRSVVDGAEIKLASLSDKYLSDDINSSTRVETTTSANTADAKSKIRKVESVWEGLLQLNISASDSVIGIFKSGEKASTKEWPGTMEIKGRVRLDAFEKFLQQLPMSRSRAVMVLHFVSKEDEPSKLREVADSYIVDDRVGFAEPAPAVELYFCPPHKKSIEMLGKILPKEQVEGLHTIDFGLIGVIVWRRTHLISSSISPTPSSHHKLSVKKHLNSRRRHESSDITNVNTQSSAHAHRGYMTSNAAAHDVDADDDIPPGFGPGAPTSRDEDDLPEFNFSGGSNSSHVLKHTNELVSRNVTHVHSRPADQLRDLVHKYGQPQTSADTGVVGVKVQPWNDDDDDIPEWQPEAALNHARPQQSMHEFQLRAHRMSQSDLSPHLPVMQMRSLQSPIQAQPYILSQWSPSSQGNGLQPNGLGCQASGEHVYGRSGQGGMQGGISWRQNLSKNRNM